MHWRRMRGASDSHLILASDTKPYVVKFVDNPQHKLVPANEWLASHLAVLLGLPVPRVALVDVSDDFVHRNPTLTNGEGSSEQPYAAGVQFGSEFVGGLLPGRTVEYIYPAQVPFISNRHDFFGVLAFDRWTCNNDARQVVFVSKSRSKNLKAYFVDHGNCFGSSDWRLEQPAMQSLYRRRSVYSDVTGLHSFEPWLKLLGTLNIDLLWQGFADMPSAWYKDSPIHPERLIQALDKRRHVVPDLLTSLARAWPEDFPQWKVRKSIFIPFEPPLDFETENNVLEEKCLEDDICQ